MTRLVLNDEQVKAVAQADGPIELCDLQGKLIGYATRPLREEVIAEALRRFNSAGPWYTTKQVQAHLDSLELE